ncbi:MAG: BolA family transcriptional regulator [Proteobacteria bacterium]|nr:BolA family transcriptional regulator [Pseudomonadota bacterium]
MFAAERIREMVEDTLPDCTCLVINEMNDGEHFQAEVVSSAFEGISLVRQHQLVYKALGGHVGTDIHALALKTYAPAAWPHGDR